MSPGPACDRCGGALIIDSVSSRRNECGYSVLATCPSCDATALVHYDWPPARDRFVVERLMPWEHSNVTHARVVHLN